jgi:hypothetical protein
MDPGEWQEIPPAPGFRWKHRPKKLRLYADASVPKIIVDELRANKILVIYAQEDGGGRWPDNQIRHRAHALGCVLLTFDRDFWQDGQHPLNRSAGIIFVDVPNDRLGDAIDALAAFYRAFAWYWPGDRWPKQKARIYSGGFTLKFVTWEGRIVEIEHRFEHGQWYERTIR